MSSEQHDPNFSAGQARRLLEQQAQSWPLLRKNLDDLAKVENRSFDFGTFVVRAQYNPSRLASVSAPVDEESIRNRRCFLCDENRPPEQASHDCGDGFKLLCNPFPILPEHFTIVSQQHRPQRIMDCLRGMLSLSRALGERYTLFYNGPQCGASATDHLHLQAGTRGFMPIDVEYDRIKHPLATGDRVTVFAGEDYLRFFVSFESNDPAAIESAFTAFHQRYHGFQPRAAEPLMNVICSYQSGTWRLIVFPRHRHRPGFYFAQDHTRMLLSPGAVDMSGVVVLPVEHDFHRITADNLAEMYRQVSVSADLFKAITRA